MIKPPAQEYEERTETAFCADIKCAAQHTVRIVGVNISQEQIDHKLRAAGWSDQPFLGQWLCPTHRRAATVRMGAYRDVD
jgi:hypothetical protein